MKESKIIFLHRPREGTLPEGARELNGIGREGKAEPQWSHNRKYDCFFLFFLSPFPISQDTNLSVSPNRSQYV